MSEKQCYYILTLRSVLKRVAQLKLTFLFFVLPLSRDDSMVMVMVMMMMMMMMMMMVVMMMMMMMVMMMMMMMMMLVLLNGCGARW